MKNLSQAFVEQVAEPLDVTLPARMAAEHPYAQGRFAVRPVFGGQGLECDPAHELLSVVMVTNGAATPVDCVPLAELKCRSVPEAAEKLTAAFTRALSRMDVTHNPDSRNKMAGWTITATGRDHKKHTLEFIREGFGEARLRETLLSRAREHAHQDLKLSTGLDYWAFCIKALRPY